MSPFFLSHTTAQEALTIIHLNTQLTAPAGEQLTVPSSLSLSLPLSLSVPDTSLLSSRPPTPAPSPSFSLFPSVSSLALPLSDKMHTSPYSHYFFCVTFPPTHSHAVLRENKYQSVVLLDVHFHMPSTNLFLFDGAFQKIFSLRIRQSHS